MNNTLKETASTVLQWLLIKKAVTVISPNPIHQLMDPIQSMLTTYIKSNPIHGWIQSMSNSALLQSLHAKLLCDRRREFTDGTHIDTCTFKLARRLYLTYYMADLVIFYVIPLFLTCLLYTLIARILFTSARPSGTPGASTVMMTDQTARAGTTLAASRVRRSTSSTSSRVQVDIFYFLIN